MRTAEVTAPGLPQRPVQRLLPAGRGLAGACRGSTSSAHGLRWAHAPPVLAHPAPDGPAAVLRPRPRRHRRRRSTPSRPATATAWLAPRTTRGTASAPARSTPCCRRSRRCGPALRLAARAGPRRPARPRPPRRCCRCGAWPRSSSAATAAALLLAGNALHADLTPEAAAERLFGWLLACSASSVGFPVPEGGAGRLTDALVAPAAGHGGGAVRCGAAGRPASTRRGGRAVGVRIAGGDDRARPAGPCSPTCDAHALYRRLVGRRAPAAGASSRLDRFQRGCGDGQGRLGARRRRSRGRDPAAAPGRHRARRRRRSTS